MGSGSTRFPLSFISYPRLERQVVGTATIILSRREWGRSTSSGSGGSGSRSRGGGSGTTHCGRRREWSVDICSGIALDRSRVNTLDVPGTNAVVPASLILVSIDVERDDELFTSLDGKLSQTFGTKDIEHHLFGEVVVCLEDKRTRFPLSTC